MDLGHHTIQLSASPGSAAAAAQPGDGGTMSSELYLAACVGKKEKAMALLRQHHSGNVNLTAGSPVIRTYTYFFFCGEYIHILIRVYQIYESSGFRSVQLNCWNFGLNLAGILPKYSLRSEILVREMAA